MSDERTQELTTEELHIRSMAAESMQVDHIVAQRFLGKAEPVAYIVTGVEGEICKGCGGRHGHVMAFVYLRVGTGFARLEHGEVKCLMDHQNSIESVLKLFWNVPPP